MSPHLPPYSETPLPVLEERIVRTLESLSRRIKASEELPGLPGAKREDEEVFLRAAA
jgi:hypothetical protein